MLFVKQPYPNHNGGQLQFGPNGLLYVGMGDGGSGGDPQNHAQDLSSRLGKLLTIDVDSRRPVVGVAGFGLRNPWRFSFDRAGNLYIGDVGQDSWEEVDYTPRSSPGLENYGWNVYEGKHNFESKEPNGAGHLVTPVAEYSHDNGCSITGGYVWKGRYYYGDFCSGRVWSLKIVGGKATGVREESINVPSLSSWGDRRPRQPARRVARRGRSTACSSWTLAGLRRRTFGPLAAERRVRERPDRLVELRELAGDEPLVRLEAAVDPRHLGREPVDPLEERLELPVGRLFRLHRPDSRRRAAR